MGQRGAQTADVIFENARVPAENVIGGVEGMGFKTAMKVLDKARLNIAAVCVGAATRILDEALQYAIERKQFGQPIGEFQLVQAMLADSQTELYAARSMTLDAARKRDDGETVTLEASCCKLYASEMVGRVADRGGADPRRRGLHAGVRRSSASIATCGCSGCTKARARFSNSSSRATCSSRRASARRSRERTWHEISSRN